MNEFQGATTVLCFLSFVVIVGLLIVRLERRKLKRFPPPAVGQVWKSEYSGKHITVLEVETTDSGDLHWTIGYETTNKCIADLRHGIWFNGMGNSYYGLSEWRRRLKNEKRVLIVE